jgi:hypothetical protein
MVVAALWEQFVPSHRGLTRDETDNKFEPRELYRSGAYDNKAKSSLPIDELEKPLGSIEFHGTEPIVATPATKKKRKRFRASKLLG